MATRLSIAKSDIERAIDALPSRVLRQKDLSTLLGSNRSFWRLAQSTTLSEFIKYLVNSSRMRILDLPLPHRSETLYLWGEVSPLVVACAAKPGAYLSHYTAMHLHELTDQEPTTIYANQEQRPLPPSASPPTQLSIDAAFRRPQRRTSNVCPLWARTLCMVNGKYTGRLGVEDRRDPTGSYCVTGLERTLIDIAVRPAYSGGVSEVLEAYRRAVNRLSVNKLAATLKGMNFVYPYEQAIGFLLERSGCKPSRLELLRSKPLEFDFYLTYAIKNPEYSPRWRLYFPAGL